MAADFKSHVLLRDEKGFMGIPFKRLLLAGVGGGLTYTLFNLAMPTWAIPAGIVLVILVLVMTGTRGGLPLWQRLMYHARGSLLLAAARHEAPPSEATALAAEALEGRRPAAASRVAPAPSIAGASAADLSATDSSPERASPEGGNASGR